MTNMSQYVHSVCGLTDPFCEHARGAKYPDDSSIRTLPFSRTHVVPFSSNANGVQCALFRPSYSYEAAWPMVAISGTTVPAWNDFLDSTSLISGAAAYRIVSSGINIKNVTAPLYASGMVHIRVYSIEDGVSLTGIDFTTYNCSYAMDIPLQDCKDVCVIVPHTSQRPEVFYTVGADTPEVALSATLGYCYITVAVSGAPASSSVLSIKTITHFELVFSAASGTSLLTTPSPTRNPMITDAANYVTSSMKPVVTAGLGAVGRYITDIAKKSLMNVVASRFPPARAMSAIMVD
jgi:hypothetical protein